MNAVEHMRIGQTQRETKNYAHMKWLSTGSDWRWDLSYFVVSFVLNVLHASIVLHYRRTHNGLWLCIRCDCESVSTLSSKNNGRFFSYSSSSLQWRGRSSHSNMYVWLYKATEKLILL